MGVTTKDALLPMPTAEEGASVTFLSRHRSVTENVLLGMAAATLLGLIGLFWTAVAFALRIAAQR
jgi:hypothetical protein